MEGNRVPWRLRTYASSCLEEAAEPRANLSSSTCYYDTIEYPFLPGVKEKAEATKD